LQSALALLKDSNVLTQIAFLGLSAGLDAHTFAHVTPHDLFWGYEDRLFSLAVTYSPFIGKLPYKKFGIFIQVVTVIPNAQDVLGC
jgi:hypothetical protein